MGEFDLIRRYFVRPATGGKSDVVLGIGDDCALLSAPPAGRVLAISTDMLIEGRHFFAGTDPASIGHKALAVNLSDLAAMGATPAGFTLAIALPSVDASWLEGFTAGLFALADRASCPLIGGDTTRGPLAISITVFGHVPAADALRRDRARAGDRIWVSGPLGGAALAVAQRRADQATDAGAARRLDWPEPRLALGADLLGIAGAAIDLSDGLAGDLGHLLAASSIAAGEPLGASLDEVAIPLDPSLAGRPAAEALRCALHGGDDYELLFTAPASADAAIRSIWALAQPVGRVVAGRGILLLRQDGSTTRLAARGFDHFSE